MRNFFVALGAVLMGLSWQAIAAVSIGARTPMRDPNNRFIGEIIRVDWTSSGAGATSGTVDMKGFILKVETVPTDSPTDNYDIALYSPNNAALDVLGGALANRDTTNAEQVYPVVTGGTLQVFVYGNQTFDITNAGATKSGKAYFYLLFP